MVKPSPTAESTTPSQTAAQGAFWNDRLQRHWGVHGVGMPAYGVNYNAWIYKVRRQVFRRAARLLNTPPEQARVLDVGCGIGVYVREWKALGSQEVSGIDIADHAIARLRLSMPDTSFHCGDISDSSDLPESNSFDIISAFDVLYHIADDGQYQQALQNISLLLKDGGYFLFSENFLHGPEKKHETYWKARTHSDIETRVRNAGFTIITRRPMLVLMNCPVDVKYESITRAWQWVMSHVRGREWLGYLLGAVLYPLESLLVKCLRESPTTEIMICQKAAKP